MWAKEKEEMQELEERCREVSSWESKLTKVPRGPLSWSLSGNYNRLKREFAENEWSLSTEIRHRLMLSILLLSYLSDGNPTSTLSWTIHGFAKFSWNKIQYLTNKEA